MPEDSFTPDNPLRHPMSKRGKSKIIVYVLCATVLFLFLYLFFLRAPSDFPRGVIFSIDQGENLRDVSIKLQEKNLIRSQILFEAFVVLYGGERRVISADYLFEDKLPVYEIARRISRGERHLAPVKVTIPEGLNVEEMALIFESKLLTFNKDKFLVEAKDLEGYLFPDTYFFFTTDTEDEVIKYMSENFKKKITPLQPKIIQSGKSEKDIIIMASLIEGEAKGESDRALISGILWKRLKIGMALQVDVAPVTYKVQGLPKSPIGNPGIEAIEAAIMPKSSSYLYYLHGKDGVTHYANTFAEHRQNILKYLK